MPIRFQVDPDFYDHPKTIGMSDAAFSLWVRAGSFSAAKLQDGFISEDVLVHTLRSSVQVADELVARGLWRRRKGGFQFHQYADRNLTRQRVEADRETDRKRKRKDRADTKPQVERRFVQSESERTPDGIQSESEGNPVGVRPLSVSSSVSMSVSGSGQARPPVRCPRHIDSLDDPPCGACREARQAAEAFDRQQTRNAAGARSAEARQRATDRARVVAGCRMCDGDGYRNGQLCNHDPDAADRAARGKAAVLAALHAGHPPQAEEASDVRDR